MPLPLPAGTPGKQAVPPDDWWEVRYTTQGSPAGRFTGSNPVPGVVYLEAPDGSTARSKAAAEKPGITITSVTGPMTPAQKDRKVGEIKVPSPLSGVAAIGDFLGRLTEANTWIRAGQVVLGLILIAVGVARITRAVPIATAVAKKAGAVAVL